ncbi:MAG: glycoside hydrolase family 16 protein [Xanthomonadales bacterium]
MAERHANDRLGRPRHALALAGACGLLALTSGPGVLAQDVLLWSDEFNSGEVPDPRIWSYDLGASGWGNEELQEYTDRPENARIENGQLIITARPQASTTAAYSSARIRTEDKVTFRYGTIEARIQVPDLANGLWPAFWTLGNNFSAVGWPDCGELDILEMGHVTALSSGLANQRVGSAAHWENNNQYATYGLFYDAAERLDEGFHLYRMEWTPDFVRTFVDGNRVWEMAIDANSCADCSEFHQPHFMILNLAVGGAYTGIYSDGGITAPLPAEMKVDYIRIYDNGHTELGGTATAVPPVNPGHSGSWYNPDEDGHGFSIEVGNAPDGSPYAVVYWYTYDTEGQPIFLVGEGVPDGSGLDVDFVSPVGMQWGVFERPEGDWPAGGSGRFEFSDEDNGVFSYEPSEFTIATWGHSAHAMDITKLFSVPVNGSTTQ